MASPKIDFTTLPYAGAMLYGGTDVNINIPSNWGQREYPFANFTTTNSAVFEKDGSGIKVKTTGWYLVSADVNLDGTFGTQIRISGISEISVVDGGNVSGMTGTKYTSSLHQITAGTTVKLNIATSNAGTYLSRRSRSHLTIVRIA